MLPASKLAWHGSIGAGYEPLCGSFLVARRPIDLPRQVQAADAARLQSGQQLPRVYVVVLHCIGRLQHDRTLQPCIKQELRCVRSSHSQAGTV